MDQDDNLSFKNSNRDPKQADIFENLKNNLFLTNRKMKVEEEKLIENMRFVSQTIQKQDDRQPNQFHNNPNLNYGGSHKYNDTYEISFQLKEQLEHLEMIKNLIEVKFGKRTPGVNFFLDDSNEEDIKENSVNLNSLLIIKKKSHYQVDQIEQDARQLLLRNEGPFNATCLRDTWSKGQEFFYVDKGDYLQVISITENGKYALCEFEGRRGLLHVNDIRVYGHAYDSLPKD